jgi:hypothetical protein
MAAVKAKEKEMKDEKEAERQVCSIQMSRKFRHLGADNWHREKYKPSRISVLQRRRKPGTRS